MYRLNLADPTKTEIGFTKRRYPDGMQQVILDEGIATSILNGIDPVMILSRFNSFQDLECIIAATKSLNILGVNDIILNIPYLLGSRADRSFEYGDNSYLRDVIAPILNSLKFTKIISLDVHNPIMAEACIPVLESQTNEGLLKAVVTNYKREFGKNKATCIIAAPDLGSKNRVYRAKKVAGDIPILQFDKSRDITGKIVGMQLLTQVATLEGDDIFIIDDIIDGGATFIECAKILKKLGAAHVFLVVSHGIFSKGFEELGKQLDHIFTTNSIQNIDNPVVSQLNIF